MCFQSGGLFITERIHHFNKTPSLDVSQNESDYCESGSALIRIGTYPLVKHITKMSKTGETYLNLTKQAENWCTKIRSYFG